MKNARLPLVAGMVVLLAGTAGCTMGYRNGQQCKQKMVETYPDSMPKLKYKSPDISVDGKRVVVEATYRTPVKVPDVTILKSKTTDKTVGVECTFNEETLKTFSWLSPKALGQIHRPESNGE